MRNRPVLNDPGIAWVPIFMNFVYLPSLDKIKDKQGVINTLLKTSDRSLAVVAKALQKEGKENREKALKKLQKNCHHIVLKRLALVLDKNGYEYELRSQIVDWKCVRVLYREHTHEEFEVKKHQSTVEGKKIFLSNLGNVR